MLRFLGRLFGWMTLISLMLWTGVACYMVMVQPRSDPPPGFPATMAECKARWAAPIAYPEVRARTEEECETYYALLGDRTTPFLSRLSTQVLTRFTSLLILDYLEQHPPAPGDVVNGYTIISALGSQRIGELLIHTVTHAHEPYLIADKAEARCRLETVRGVQSQYDLAMVSQTCLRSR